MDSVSRYGYINAKLRARIGQLRNSDMLDRMMRAPTLVESVAVLKGTRFEKLVSVYEKTGDLQQVELELFAKEIEIHEEIKTDLDAQTSAFVSIIEERLEEENVKNIIRAWYSSVLLDHHSSRMNYIYKGIIVNKINWVKIANALSYSDVLLGFDGTPWHEALKNYSGEKLRKEGVFNLEIELDHLWYKRLFKAADRLDKTDKNAVLSIYNVEADLKNILYLIRYGYFYKFKSAELSVLLLPFGQVYDGLNALMDKDEIDFEESKRIVKKGYPGIYEVFSKLEDKEGSPCDLAEETVEIENYLAKHRQTAFTSILSRDPFTIGTILAYIFLYKGECHMIRSILSAKYYSWGEDKIRRKFN